MIIIDLTYKKPLEEVDKYLEAHRDFLQKYYDEGVLLASGPKDPRNGGIIIALADQETIHEIIQQDPFYQNDIADYAFTFFEPVKHCDALKNVLK